VALAVVLATLCVHIARAPQASATTFTNYGQFFAPTSFWNTPLGPSTPIDTKSADYVGDLQRQVKWGPWINTTSYSTPIYQVPIAQPLVKVTLDTADSTGRLQGAFAAVPLPDNAQPSSGADGHLTVLQPESDTLWEFWQLSYKSDGWHARWGGKMGNVSSNPGYFSDPWYWGATATSLPLVGGLITLREMQDGHIDHALAIAIPEPRYHLFTWPAQRTDGFRFTSTAIPEGTRFRIDPNLDLSTLSMPTVTRMIAEAVQKYGMVVRDRAGSVSFYAEDPTPTGTNPYPGFYNNQYPDKMLASFPWARLQALPTQFDTTAPTTTITAGPPSLASSRQVSFSYTSNEPAVTFSCTLDGGDALTDCGTSRTFYNVTDGNHEFLVKARDNANNKDAVGAKYDFTVDATAPTTTMTGGPPPATNQTAASISFVASEAEVSFSCVVDGGAAQPCTSPLSLGPLDEGAHEVDAWAVDGAGNTGPFAAWTWRIDQTAPETTIGDSPGAVTNNPAPSITFTSSEADSTFLCSLDGASPATCATPFSASAPTEGSHTFAVVAVDPAGNVDGTPSRVSWKTDTTAPVSRLTSTPPSSTTSRSASFFFAVSEKSRFECKLDSAAWQPCSSGYSYSYLTYATHTFLLRATDLAGNVEATPPSYSWTVTK
jgi:hypothetical protein